MPYLTVSIVIIIIIINIITIIFIIIGIWALTTAPLGNWYSIASDSTGTYLAASQGGGYIYTSSDG